MIDHEELKRRLRARSDPALVVPDETDRAALERIEALEAQVAAVRLPHEARYNGEHRCSVCGGRVMTVPAGSDRSRWVHVVSAVGDLQP